MGVWECWGCGVCGVCGGVWHVSVASSGAAQAPRLGICIPPPQALCSGQVSRKDGAAVVSGKHLAPGTGSVSF